MRRVEKRGKQFVSLDRHQMLMTKTSSPHTSELLFFSGLIATKDLLHNGKQDAHQEIVMMSVQVKEMWRAKREV